MIWFISDTHFNHNNIIKYSNRPFFSVQEMNETMISNWNNCVAPGETIFHLGDFMCGKRGDVEGIKNLVSRLNGTKVLILGNHDQEIIKHQNDLIGPNLFSSIV